MSKSLNFVVKITLLQKLQNITDINLCNKVNVKRIMHDQLKKINIHKCQYFHKHHRKLEMQVNVHLYFTLLLIKFSFRKIKFHSQLYICCKFTHFIISIIRVRSGQIRFLTVHFHFTEGNENVIRIPLRIRRMSSVVVVVDVSPVVRTADVDRIRYRGVGVVGVPKTQHSVLFVCCVGDVDRESQELLFKILIFI